MKKLNKYLSLSAALISGSTLNAGIVYTDVNPDELLDNFGDFYEIDLDNSGGFDFKAVFDGNGGGYGNVYFPRVEAQLGNQIAGFTGYNSYNNSTNYYAGLYSLNDNINSSLNWMSYVIFGWKWIAGGGYGNSASEGDWAGEIDKYVALKFGQGGNTYYGWARFDVGPDYDYILLKDFAYENTPNTSINAGSNINLDLIANNVTSNDIANNHNGLDLEVSFDKANSETGISEYRVIVTKSSNVNNFFVSDANSTFSYITVMPDGNNHTVVFNSNSKDSDGDLIVEGTEYNVFVLSVPDLINLSVSNLSNPSNAITLQSKVGIYDNVFNNINLNIKNKRVSVSSNYNIDNLIVNDINGKLVYKQSNFTTATLNLSNQKTGIYFITIEKNNKIETKKIIL